MTPTPSSPVRAAHDIPTAAVTAFADRLRGSLVQPRDAAYDEARSIYNGMIDKHPGFIAQCLVQDINTGLIGRNGRVAARLLGNKLKA